MNPKLAFPSRDVDPPAAGHQRLLRHGQTHASNDVMAVVGKIERAWRIRRIPIDPERARRERNRRLEEVFPLPWTSTAVVGTWVTMGMAVFLKRLHRVHPPCAPQIVGETVATTGGTTTAEPVGMRKPILPRSISVNAIRPSAAMP